ncbi:MAG TPA: hypothetical protein VIK08_07110 [Candidatus Limnocylindrales bacterium]
MTEPADPVAAEAVAHHDAATHMDTHASLSDDDHGHAAETLGPIDWQKWAFAVAGGIAGLIVLVFFFAAIS